MSKSKRFVAKMLPCCNYGIFDKSRNDFVRNQEGILFRWRRKWVASEWIENNQAMLAEIQSK